MGTWELSGASVLHDAHIGHSGPAPRTAPRVPADLPCGTATVPPTLPRTDPRDYVSPPSRQARQLSGASEALRPRRRSMHEYPTRLHSPTRRIRPPWPRCPAPGPRPGPRPARGPTHRTPSPQPELLKLSGTRANRPSGAFGRQYGGGPESMQTDGFTLFTTELIALTLMALPDYAPPVRSREGL
jgi:hypothetical protein